MIILAENMTSPDSALTALIVEVVPEIKSFKRKGFKVYTNEHLDSVEVHYRKIEVYRPISLADVLRAIGKYSPPHHIWCIDRNGRLFQLGTVSSIPWNLSLSLLEQTEEVKMKLLELLKP
jgi:hypothetical protein